MTDAAWSPLLEKPIGRALATAGLVYATRQCTFGNGAVGAQVLSMQTPRSSRASASPI